MPRITTLELADSGVAVVHAALTKYYKDLKRRGRVGLTDRIAICDVIADLEKAAPESLRGELQLCLTGPADSTEEPSDPPPES